METTWKTAHKRMHAYAECAGEPLDVPEETSDETITAVRAWRVTDDGVLMSVVYDVFWMFRFKWARQNQPTLAENKMDGINALKPLVSAQRLIHAYPGARAVGEVELFGTVVEHELGYRAEFARIKRLWVLPKERDPTDPFGGPLVTMWEGYLDAAEGYKWARSMVEPLQERYECEVSVIEREVWDAYCDPKSIRAKENKPDIEISKPKPKSLIERVTAGSFLDTLEEFKGHGHW